MVALEGVALENGTVQVVLDDSELIFEDFYALHLLLVLADQGLKGIGSGLVLFFTLLAVFLQLLGLVPQGFDF